MRVHGNLIPESLHIEQYEPEPGTVEIRVRENVHQITLVDDFGQEIHLYEYDEYVLRIKDRPGLREDIEANLPDYLATGRVLEVNESASIVVDLKNAFTIMGGVL